MSYSYFYLCYGRKLGSLQDWIILYLKTSFLPVRESSKGASMFIVELVSIPIDQWVEEVLPFIFFYFK